MTSEYQQVEREAARAGYCRSGAGRSVRNLYAVLLEACATVGINTEGNTEVINIMNEKHW